MNSRPTILIATWALLGLIVATWGWEAETRRQQRAHHSALEHVLVEEALRLREMEAELAEISARMAQVEARVVVYRPTGALTASGRRGRPGTTCAVSRGLRERLGLNWGDLVVIPGRGVWEVEDLMGEEIKGDSIDLMLPRQAQAFREVTQVVFVRGDG